MVSSVVLDGVSVEEVTSLVVVVIAGPQVPWMSMIGMSPFLSMRLGGTQLPVHY